MQKYRTLLADPPWQQKMSGRWAKHKIAKVLPYAAMSVQDIKALPIRHLVADDCQCYLWTTNQFLRHGYDVLEAWGFKYMSPIVWVKPSGIGSWWINRTQTMLMGYRGKCEFKERYQPNVLFASPLKHSQKPICSYELIEKVGFGPRLELFARHKRPGWDVWGNEVVCDVDLCAL